MGNRNNDTKFQSDLKRAFEVAMLGTYDQAKELGYIAMYFKRLINERGGVDAAKQLLAKKGTQEGLDFSAEALVLQDKFQPLFSETERAEAHR